MLPSLDEDRRGSDDEVTSVCGLKKNCTTTVLGAPSGGRPQSRV